jgi:hypothetical protein
MTFEEAINNAWDYWDGDDEWRLWANEGDEIIAIIYFHGYTDGKCGLRVPVDSDEIEFPDLWTAKLHGFAVAKLLRARFKDLSPVE